MTNNSREISVSVANGWVMLGTNILGFLLAIGLGVTFIYNSANSGSGPSALDFGLLIFAVIILIGSIVMTIGFFTLQPNESCVLNLFGAYKGTCKQEGFRWANPFNTRGKISLRSRNFNSPTLKVNDKRGNPIEIGAVVVWKVADTAQACFDVDNYREFVEVQSESALRNMASKYSYDDGEEGEVTLRSGTSEVSITLQSELQKRLNTAGVVIEEARISHLAYASEIAGAMLKRQQAEAVIAARTKIVHGAVSMVEMALNDLSERNVVHLDDERRANMVSNLLVVLCSESETNPVINTGTLY